MGVIVIALSIALAGAAYIRLAPSGLSKWHIPLNISENADFRNGAKRVFQLGPDGLARLDAIARATPRTTVLAGSVASGSVTYITRSRVLGFPDYTTLQQSGDNVLVFARSRFGRSDLGVNRARVAQWGKAVGETD
jgi:uncharacterized protein (DUF1499 family)